MISVCCLCGIFFATASACALENGDWQLWNTDSAEVKLDKRWKIKAEEELRFGKDISELYYTHTDGGINLNVTDGLDLGINYRQVYEKKEDEWKEECRPHFNAAIKWEWGEFKLSDRSRLELRTFEDKDDEWRYRNKFSVVFPWKWTFLEIQPYIADEVFVDFHGEKLNRNRFYGGFSYKLCKYLKGGIFYMWQISKRAGDKWTGYNVLGIEAKLVF